MIKENTNSRIFKEARKYLVGGVNSPVRAFNYVGGKPLLVKRGRGSKVYDYDGMQYIDYVLSWGSLILGHAFPKVVNAVKGAAGEGFSFGATNSKEIELAKLIQEAIPFIDKVRFVNSGTEAVMGAVRTARGYTGRNKILKFEHSYHGHADYLLAQAGSGLATLNIAQSQGVPKDFIKDTLIIPYRDSVALNKTFKKYGRQIAAVLVEPVGGNYGLILPDIDFLKRIRKITREYGALLIADEIITGFRFNPGSFTYRAGVTPDFITLGKIIGGGLPIGAYAGKKEIMDIVAPLGKVYQSSTFGGNPVVMSAGIATIKELKKNDYKKINNLNDLLVKGLREKAKAHNIGLEVNSFGSMFSLRFKSIENFRKFYRGMLSGGVYFAQSEFEANFISFAHSKQDILKTIGLADKVLLII